MKKVYLLGVLVGSLEVALVTWLTIQTFFNAGWWGVGLLAYFIYCFIIGATLKNVLVLALTSMFLTIAYVEYGIKGALLLYVLILITVEFFPFGRKNRQTNNEPSRDEGSS